jgi:hypothetical protein
MLPTQLKRSLGAALALVAALAGVATLANPATEGQVRAGAQAAQVVDLDRNEPAPRPEAVLDAALKASDRIRIPQRKHDVLADIAAVQARLGQRDQARATFRRAAELDAVRLLLDTHAMYWYVEDDPQPSAPGRTKSFRDAQK